MRRSSSTPITPKPLASADRHLEAAHGHVGLARHVRRQHRAVVHLVDVVAGQDQHVLGVVGRDDVQVLPHRIGGAGVPGGLQPLLGRQQLHELAELAAQLTPAALDVQQQRVRLVLREHADAADARVDAVGQRKVDDAELAAEGHRRLGPPQGELFQAAAAPAGQDQRQGVARQFADEAFWAFGTVHAKCLRLIVRGPRWAIDTMRQRAAN